MSGESTCNRCSLMQMDANNNTIHVITSFFYPQIPTKLWNLLSDHCNVIKILATTGLPTAVAVHFYVPSSPAQQAFLCGLGANNGERESKTARKMAQVKFFGSRFISRAVKTKNPLPRSFFAPKPNGNACLLQGARLNETLFVP